MAMTSRRACARRAARISASRRVPSDARVWMCRSARPSRSVIGRLGSSSRLSGQIGKNTVHHCSGASAMARSNARASASRNAPQALAPRLPGRGRAAARLLHARAVARPTPTPRGHADTEDCGVRPSRSPAGPGPAGSGAGAPKSSTALPAAADARSATRPTDLAALERRRAARCRAGQLAITSMPSPRRASARSSACKPGSPIVSIGAMIGRPSVRPIARPGSRSRRSAGRRRSAPRGSPHAAALERRPASRRRAVDRGTPRSTTGARAQLDVVAAQVVAERGADQAIQRAPVARRGARLRSAMSCRASQRTTRVEVARAPRRRRAGATRYKTPAGEVREARSGPRAGAARRAQDQQPRPQAHPRRAGPGAPAGHRRSAGRRRLAPSAPLGRPAACSSARSSGQIGLKLYHCSGAVAIVSSSASRSPAWRAAAPRARIDATSIGSSCVPGSAVGHAPDRDAARSARRSSRRASPAGRQRRPLAEEPDRDVVGAVAPVDDQAERSRPRAARRRSRAGSATG